jgi:hypothetical protein
MYYSHYSRAQTQSARHVSTSFVPIWAPCIIHQSFFRLQQASSKTVPICFEPFPKVPRKQASPPKTDRFLPNFSLLFTKFIPMSIDALLSRISDECQDLPDMEWTSELPADTNLSSTDNFLFHSFNSFIHFPLSNLSFGARIDAEKLSPDLLSQRAKPILSSISSLQFSAIASWALLALALPGCPDLLSLIPRDAPVIPRVWCLAQCIDQDRALVLSQWRDSLFHPPPYKNRVDCQAVLLLLECCVRHSLPGEDIVPPFRSDEFETVFCLAYASKGSSVRTVARWILPELVPLIAQSNAAHLVFRRILPYCAMEDREGHDMAMHIAEEVIGHQLKFPSCVSTWMTMHPFCLAASNNLLVDLQKRGLLTAQMKPLIKQLINMNRRLLKKKIKLTEDVRRALPRSLWNVQFPPPEREITECTATCRKLLASIESKRSVLLTLLVAFVVMYAIYIVWD